MLLIMPLCQQIPERPRMPQICPTRRDATFWLSAMPSAYIA